jgi:hypothetical protein
VEGRQGCRLRDDVLATVAGGTLGEAGVRLAHPSSRLGAPLAVLGEVEASLLRLRGDTGADDEVDDLEDAAFVKTA